jgi:hypothetical protein
MMEEIELNGKKYVLKETSEIKNQGVMDVGNVCMLTEFPSDTEKNNIIKFSKPNLCFKLSFSEDDNKDAYYSFDKEIVITPNKTKVSSEMIEMCRKVLALMCYNKKYSNTKLTYYEGWDENEEKFKKDYPIYVTDLSRGFIIAPRVDSD